VTTIDRPPDLCRCECISVEVVERAIAEGNRTINDVKRRTRAGMGICQGAYCVEHIAVRSSTRAWILPLSSR
jgi:NAD(P)H-nitrite reductase large subunit